jgi:hypothetical protein
MLDSVAVGGGCGGFCGKGVCGAGYICGEGDYVGSVDDGVGWDCGVFE